MEIVWVSNDFGGPEGERANGELKNLEPFGGVSGFEITDFGGVEWEMTLPGRRVSSGRL